MVFSNKLLWPVKLQLYIQESVLYTQKLDSSVAVKPVPWKVKQSRPLLGNGETALSLHDSESGALSLIALYGSDSGTFLEDKVDDEQIARLVVRCGRP